MALVDRTQSGYSITDNLPDLLSPFILVWLGKYGARMRTLTAPQKNFWHNISSLV